MSVPLTKNSKLYISSYMQRLLNKKVNLTASSRIELMQIKLPFFKKIKIILIALILFLFYCTKIFRIAPKKNKIRENKTVLIYSLTKDQIFKDNSISKLHDFLVSKKFNISEKNEILIECRRILRSRMYSNLVVTFDIPLRIFTTKLSLKGQLKLLLVFFCKLTILVKSFNNSQYIYLVFREYVFDENVYFAIANKNTINKIITTPTAIQYQPISFEIPDFAVERVMLWYSTNSIPIKYKSRKTSIFEKNLENSLQRMAIDTHWVWTNEHKKYLKKMTNSAILVRGSMIFYNPTKKLDSNKKYDVVIFDVTPQNSKSVFKDTIYSFPVAKEFIDDIIESVDLVSQKLDRNIGIYIKHKRNFAPTHSSKYIAYIDVLAKNRQLSVLPLDSDLYEIIATSKIVIGFPFTSPVIIGQELKVPSIYYSSTSTLVKYNQANFIQSKLELRKYIETNLGK